MSEVPKVTPKDTKAVILAAHKDALAKLATLEKNPRAVAERQKNSEIVAKQSGVSIENIVNDLASTRLLVTDGLADLEKSLVEKRTQLDEIQVSIKAEDENLKDVMGISRQADSFVALVQAHKATQDVFARENSEARTSWTKEQQLHQASVLEREVELRKQQERKREEYGYAFAKEKEEASDAFDQEKKIRLRSLEEHEGAVTFRLKEREDFLKGQEAEFTVLKHQVETFPGQLEDAVSKAAEEAKARASKSYGFESRALKKDAESASALAEQRISNLEGQVDSLEKERDSLRNGLEKSQAEVKDIATEAIKGAQTKNYYTPGSDSKK